MAIYYSPVACNFHRKSSLDVTSVCCACRINATISPIITTNMRMRIQKDSSIGLGSNEIFIYYNIMNVRIYTFYILYM